MDTTEQGIEAKQNRIETQLSQLSSSLTSLQSQVQSLQNGAQNVGASSDGNPGSTTPGVNGPATITVDGQSQTVTALVSTNGSTYIAVWDFMQVLKQVGATARWDGATLAVNGTPYTFNNKFVYHGTTYIEFGDAVQIMEDTGRTMTWGVLAVELRRQHERRLPAAG